MSYPIQEYNPTAANNPNNNNALVDQQFDRTLFNDNNDGNIVRSFFGLANRMMGEMLNSRSGFSGLSSFGSSDPNNPNVKVFGISSMNVTQISRGPDGRPHIVQAHDERRMGPGGIWQTKKALRDPDRGIDRMQVGYFIGDQGEIIERQRDPTSGQYRQEVKRRGFNSNDPNFSNQWRVQAQQAMQRPPPLPSNSNPYPQQALPAPNYYDQQYSQPVTSYDQYSEPISSYDPYSQQNISYDSYTQPTNSYQYY